MMTFKAEGKGIQAYVNIKLFWFLLIAVIVISVLPYRQLFSRGFSDTDDFLELHRAVTTDITAPSKIFLTPHYSNRYRPVNRIITATTTYLFGLNAQGFLLRNLVFHIASVILVFLIALSLTGNQGISAITSVLFALHPSNVNFISVAINTHSFGSCLILLAVFLLIPDNISNGYIHVKYRKVLLSLSLLIIATCSTEMYLWVLPIFMIYMIWLFCKNSNKQYLFFAFTAILFVLFFLAVRHSIIDSKIYTISNYGDTYGLRGLWQIAMNFAMYLTAAGFSLDPLLFFNPVVQTLPMGSDLLKSPGLVFSLLMSFVVVFGTLFGIVSVVPSWRHRNNLFILLFFSLFLLSLSVILISAKASETYMYLPNAFMALTQGLLLNELMRLSPEDGCGLKTTYVVVTLLFLVMVIRCYSVDHRNRILADKANRVQYMQNEIRRALKDNRAQTIFFATLCPERKGYSVYGGQGINILMGRGCALGRETKFVQLTLGDMKVKAKSMAFSEVMKEDKLPGPIGTKILFIDDEGSIYENPNQNFKCR